mmetsp:Transcript_935/g.5877  ORF Transcript_935/g.5877 Transcript_935/m.5877 type:complete len:213 (+) Transcript_935:2283-2921(+)
MGGEGSQASTHADSHQKERLLLLSLLHFLYSFEEKNSILHEVIESFEVASVVWIDPFREPVALDVHGVDFQPFLVHGFHPGSFVGVQLSSSVRLEELVACISTVSMQHHHVGFAHRLLAGPCVSCQSHPFAIRKRPMTTLLALRTPATCQPRVFDPPSPDHVTKNPFRSRPHVPATLVAGMRPWPPPGQARGERDPPRPFLPNRPGKTGRIE